MMAYDITIIGARLKACERPGIKEARVLNGTSPYALSFDARTDGVEALGYLVSNHVIRKALYDEVQTLQNVDIFPDLAVTAVATNADSAPIVLSDGQEMKSRLIVVTAPMQDRESMK